MNILVSKLTPNDVAYLDDLLLDATGRIRLHPASVYQEIEPLHLTVWGVLKARYCYPTVELVEWLRNVIGDRKALEIAAGNGDLGYHLGIPMTDNYCQQYPDVKAYYELTRQVPTNPRPDVEKLDAIAALEKYSPEVVVGSFVTQVHRQGEAKGNMYGPDEELILKGSRCYVHIGNELTHGDKRILKHTHESFRFDWLVTRSVEPRKNIIYVWGEM
jgi:hypothetical protein